MRTRIRCLILIATVLCLFDSCVPVNRFVYRSTPVDAPGLTKKGDSQLIIGVGGNTTSDGLSGQSGLDIRGAYAVSAQWSITGGYSQRTGIDGGNNDSFQLFNPNPYPSDTSNLQYRNENWNVGVVFTPHIHGPFYLMAAAGVGLGDYDLADQGVYHDTSFSTPFNCRFYNYYLQGGLLFKIKNMDMGGGLRNTWYQYDRVITHYTAGEQRAFNVDGLQGTALSLAQLYGFFRVYAYHRVLSLQLQWSIDGASASNGINYNGYPLSGSIGLGVDISRFIRLMGAHSQGKVF